MKGSVILLGVCCFITLLAAGEGSRCGNRSQRRYWESVRKDIACMQPKLQLLQLPVPDGYDYVEPPVAYLKQCSGHRCPTIRNKCVATDHTDMKLAVKAYKRNDVVGTCVDIHVQEHLDCGCQCTTKPSDCSQTEMYDDDMCKCVCRPESRDKCMQRKTEGLPVMWGRGQLYLQM